MCNTDQRLTDTRSKRRAYKAMLYIVSIKGQRGAARMLKINPGTVNHIKANTSESWTHVALTAKLLAKIELLEEYVKHDADLPIEIKSEMDHVMEIDAELTAALRELRRKIRRL